LYGSYAHGKAREHSDIDIAVISPFFRGRGIRERQEFLGLAFGDIYEPIEPLGYTPEEYEHAEPGTMLHEIKRTGIVIYQARQSKTSKEVPQE
jgi:predicted nucleotidyltransferase